jgi:protein-S-isoprenylcysteine O-methyltransferase Ste14
LGYLPIWEEKGLILKFGDDYQRYMQKVSMNVKLSVSNF